ncbi:MAG: hypothetical protein U9P80_10225 [Thermodesulfobacteriota bacterium]|nr:hypothetical protein [Thermodesulfobacteriota bacterium]
MAARRCRDSGSWVEAANLYIMAQRCIDETGTGTGTGDQLTKILEGIWECTRVFRPDMAIDALERLGAYYNEQAMKKERDFVQIRLINLYSQKGTFDKALDTFNKIDGDTKMTKALSECAVAYTYTFLGRQDTAIEHLERSRPVLATGQRFFLAVNTITTLAAYVWKGAIREALYWYSRTKKLSKGHLDLELMADIWLGYIDFLSGNFTSGTKTFLRILDAQERLGSTAGGLSYIHTQSSLYFSAVYMGNLEQASHDLERFVHLDRTLCVNGAKALRDLYDAWICLEKGLSTKAIDLLEGALPSLKKGAANRVPYAINALCAAHLDTGEISCAQDLAARGIAWNERFGNQDQLIWSYRSAAKACIMKNDLEQAKPLLVRASMLSKKCMMKPHMAWNHSVWALYWKKQGDKEKADACTGRSQRMWLEMECPYQAEKIP